MAVREEDGKLFCFALNDCGQCTIPADLQGKPVGIPITAGYKHTLHTRVREAQQQQVEQALLCLLVLPTGVWVAEDPVLHALEYLKVRVCKHGRPTIAD